MSGGHASNLLLVTVTGVYSPPRPLSWAEARGWTSHVPRGYGSVSLGRRDDSKQQADGDPPLPGAPTARSRTRRAGARS